MATLLVINTSSDTCSVIVSKSDQFQELNSVQPKTHASLLLSMIDELLTKSDVKLDDLDALGVVSGPGSFTGLRIGISVTQGLSFALNKPVILLSSLELLASEAALKVSTEGILVAIRSKHNEIYFACYRKAHNGNTELIGREKVIAPGDVYIPSGAGINKWYGIGDGWPNVIKIKNPIGLGTIEIDESLTISANVLNKLAHAKFASHQTVEAENALPNYLKEQLDYQTSQ